MNQHVGLCGLKSKVQIGDETNHKPRTSSEPVILLASFITHLYCFKG